MFNAISIHMRLIPILFLAFFIYSIVSIAFVYQFNPEKMTLLPNYYEYFSVNIVKGQVWIFNITASNLVTIMIMDPQDFYSFRNGYSASSLYIKVSQAETFEISNPGSYYIVIYNNVSKEDVTVKVDYTSIPVDLYYVHQSLPAPIGIAYYGEYNGSDFENYTTLKYEEAIGYATLYSISAYNSTPPALVNPYGSSLQLNAMLQVNTETNSYQFWLQNVIGFITSGDYYYIWDNVWNSTSRPSLLTNSSVTGNGAVCFYDEKNGYYYRYATGGFNYTFPFSVILYIKLQNVTPNGVIVSFGYNNGGGVIWYDNVTIHVNHVTSAYMLIDPMNMTGGIQYYDLELVFGGESNGEYTYFKSLNASLALAMELPNGNYVNPYPLYTFGSDTEESADNLQTVFFNGHAYVTLGNNNFYTQGASTVPELFFPNTENTLTSKSVENTSLGLGITNSENMITIQSVEDIALGLGIIIVIIAVIIWALRKLIRWMKRLRKHKSHRFRARRRRYSPHNRGRFPK
jgi:Thermopsin.